MLSPKILRGRNGTKIGVTVTRHVQEKGTFVVTTPGTPFCYFAANPYVMERCYFEPSPFLGPLHMATFVNQLQL